MSNIGNHSLPIFEDNLPTIKEYLKIALNTVFFHRWLNNNNYIEEKSIINNISYIKINDESLQKEINNKLSQIDNYSNNSINLQITLSFFTKINTQFYLFSKNDGLWEKWNFLISISNDNTPDKEGKIRTYITKLLEELNRGNDFMPDLELDDFGKEDSIKDNKNEFYFPYEIKILKEYEQDSFLKILQNINFKDTFNIKI